jgi:hypothetical protein
MDHSEAMKISLQNAELLHPYTVPIIHYEASETNASRWKSGGSGLLLDTGECKLLVTAAHVIEGFITSAGNDFITLIGSGGGGPTDISDWPIVDLDSNLDICTRNVSASFNPSISGKRFCRPRQWPCRRAAVGEQAVIVGYPAGHRDGSAQSVFTGITVISEFVVSSNPERFILVNENAPREIYVAEGHGSLPEHFGGMSGAPVWAIRDGWAEPVGVFVEGVGAESPFFATHLDFVRCDGTIDAGQRS